MSFDAASFDIDAFSEDAFDFGSAVPITTDPLHVGLRNELIAATTTAAYLAGVPDRVYPLVIPQKVPGGAAQVPCVVYAYQSIDRQTTYCGVSGLARATMMLDCYATTYDEARDLAAAVFAVLTDFRGMLGGVTAVRTATLETELDLEDPEPGLYRVMQTWTIWYEEL
jgi:hypothetical protein